MLNNKLIIYRLQVMYEMLYNVYILDDDCLLIHCF